MAFRTLVVFGAAALALFVLGCADRDALRADGGANAEAVLARLAPSPGITAIAAGGGAHFATFAHVCAVAGGGLQCWGAGEDGQLGDGRMPHRSPFPVEIFPHGSGVEAVAAGRVHTCALVAGEVHCWGGNYRQQVGPRRPFMILRPRKVAGLASEAVGIAAGADHSCAITADGVWCWGENADGRTGAPACEKPPCELGPQRVAGLAANVRALALGGAHGCALADGIVQCWGDNARGQLGDGTTTSRHTPAPVAGLPAGVTAIAVGAEHSCALASGALYCWGANAAGQLGDGGSEDRVRPAAVADLSTAALAVASGTAHTCAASADAVRCWGDGREGQLDGAPRGSVNPRPIAVPHLPGGVRALAAGPDVSCALRSDDRVQCWGDNDFAQLGSGDAPLDHPGSAGVTRWDDGRLVDRDGSGRIAVACLGDSNSREEKTRARSWCDRLADRAPADRWRIVNRSEGGATAVTDGSLILAEEHLEYALENDAVDAVVFAYGTNDLLAARASPAEVANAISRLRRRARDAGVDVFVALTPPLRPPNRRINTRVAEVNSMLRHRFPADRVIDFASGLAAEDYVDGVHLGETGQEKRARAAWAVLSAAAQAPGSP